MYRLLSILSEIIYGIFGMTKSTKAFSIIGTTRAQVIDNGWRKQRDDK